MSYWKGLMLAVAIDLVWIMGCPFLATEPDPPPVQRVDVKEGVQEVARLTDISALEDSLMLYLQENGEEVNAMERLAQLYLDNGWYEAAIGPIARAIQLDAERWSLWVALNRALEKTQRKMITDAELTQKALDFRQAVEMWGNGC